MKESLFKTGPSEFQLLLVDDSESTRKYLQKVLEGSNYKVIDTAQDGEEAFQKYCALFPLVDLVTLDISMPKMNGIECLEKLLEFDRNAKVIMMSSIAKEDIIQYCKGVGACDYLVKPLNADTVLERIRTILNP